MNRDKDKMPMYGVGPLFVGIIILLTLIGVILNHFNIISSGRIVDLKVPFLIIGIVLILAGIILWILAVFKDKIDKGIEDNKLVTSGVYSLCRNPIYTAFMMACTGVCLFTYNLWLLILPFLYWILLTIFMKNTEEKWLQKAFGEEYIDYCKRVNRCIPWIKNSKKQ